MSTCFYHMDSMFYYIINADSLPIRNGFRYAPCRNEQVCAGASEHRSSGHFFPARTGKTHI